MKVESSVYIYKGSSVAYNTTDDLQDIYICRCIFCSLIDVMDVELKEVKPVLMQQVDNEIIRSGK